MREARKGYAAARGRAWDSKIYFYLYEIWLIQYEIPCALSGRGVRHAYDHMGVRRGAS